MSKNQIPINSLNQDFTNSTQEGELLSNFNSTDANLQTSSNKIKPPKIMFLKSKVFLIVLAFSILLLVGIFLVWFYFIKPGSSNNNNNNISIKNPSVSTTKKNKNSGVTSKEFVNPINGIYLSQKDFELVNSRKPVSVTLNNHVDARPQAGISEADIVYEINAEGGISRIMPIFHSKIPEKVGSVRSARIYFLQVAAEYFPIFSHWGIAHRPDYEKNLSQVEFNKLLALGEAETDPRSDARSYIDEIAIPVANTDTTPDLFYRENLPIAIEHTGYAKFSNVYTEFKKYYPEESWSAYQPFESWQFKEDDDFKLPGEKVNTIYYNFWDFANFDTLWTYKPDSNSYQREQGKKVTTDRNNNEPVLVSTLIVQKTKETKLNDKKGHLLYDIIGSGDATIYMDGVKIAATWEKESARSRTVFKDNTGAPIVFNRGLIWVTILPDYSIVTEE